MVKKEVVTESKRKGADSSEADSGFKLVEFLKGTREELGKVVWPSRQQLISESAAV
ncbi:MAG: preprotein translocase subunit SecE, partial [Leptolyngbyaceae cyanobacterium SM2_5_2]|nr:preprotein translocase subunit SecE [Leptolyngbyaceae cyanobacterium SM2_5_2]